MKRRRCVWCGGGPLTREHVIPAWLRDVLAHAFQGDGGGYDFASRFNTADEEGPLRSYAQVKPELVVKAACETCNGGWMACLEAETMPILAPMVRGERKHLEVDAQAVLAHWVSKTVVVLGCHEASAVILDSGDLDQISRRGTAPIGFHIRLAYRADEDPSPFDIYGSTHFAAPPGAATRDEAERSDPNAFSVTLGVGRVAIAVVGGPGVANPQRWVSGGTFPLMIWPPTADGIDWPPSAPLLRSRDDLQQFHEAFWTGILNPEFPRPDALRKLVELGDGTESTRTPPGHG